MFKHILLLVICTAFISTVLAENKKNESNIKISFYSPMDDQLLSYNESSFSVPQPIIELDELVFGDPDKHPGKTTIQQISADKYKIRVSGTVYDSVADIVAGGEADIKQVTIENSAMGTIATLPITTTNDDEAPIETLTKEEQDDLLYFQAISPYSYTGRFESESITMHISPGSNDIYVKAVNINKKYGVGGIRINTKVNREEKRFEITAELRKTNDDVGLVNPILVYIEDPFVNQGNVDNVHATLNGTKVGLRIIDGQLQLDRPIMGVNFTPPKSIPNIVNVTGNPDKFVIRYKDVETTFNWSFTAH